MNRHCKIYSDDGNILLMSIVIVALLVASGLSYMKWATDERWDTAYEEATVKAYFLAQSGLIEQGLQYLRTRKPTELPTGTVYLDSRAVEGYGIYYNVKVVRVFALGEGNVFQRSDTYDVFSTGRAEFVNHKLGNRTYGQKNYVERTSKMRARLRSFANYMYLTDMENTRFNEIIWFWSYDTLYGRTHSNDFIGLKYSPHFYGPVSTCKDRFLYEQPGNIHFEYEPQFKVPPVLFPKEANTLRGNANPFISDDFGRYMTRVYFRGEEGINIYQYLLGADEPDLYEFAGDEVVNMRQIPLLGWGAIFVDGQVEVYGTVVGNLTLGSSQDMWLVDNVRYADTNPTNGHWNNPDEDYKGGENMLGLVSEKNIIIKNNSFNGRNNGNATGNENRRSIIINAGMVALGESFTFQHQNDEWELYQGPSPDERGIIHLVGAVTQVRRGYVHRSNHNGTGYGKDYHYDFRFDDRPPPFYLEAMDENGNGLFDIISWGELEPTR